MEYQVGDKVRIRSDLIPDQIYGHVLFATSMACTRGCIDTIGIVRGGGTYILSKASFINNGCYIYSSEMLEPVSSIPSIDLTADEIMEFLHE